MKHNVKTRDVEAEAVEGVLFCGSRSVKILPLPLQHRLFDLKSNLAKKFVHFLMWIKRGSCAIRLYRFYSLWRENKVWFRYSSNQFGGFASLLYHGQLSQNLTRLLNRPAYFWYLSI